MTKDHIARIEATPVRIRKRIDGSFDAFEGLIQTFAQSSDAERVRIQKALNDKTANKLLVFGGRCAEKAIDDGNSVWVDFGVLAHILQGFRGDFRENYYELAVLDHAGRRINYGLNDAYGKYRHLATDHTDRYFVTFLQRDPALNTLSVFGLEEHETPDGVQIVPCK